MNALVTLIIRMKIRIEKRIRNKNTTNNNMHRIRNKYE